MMSVYEKIEFVLKLAGKPLAPHEFVIVMARPPEGQPDDYAKDGREYIGCSESALGRRLREMWALGRVTKKRREGKAFVEYSLAVREPVAA